MDEHTRNGWANSMSFRLQLQKDNIARVVMTVF
jgi:hypothetical protein